jgi:uncharacterized membrane protein YidH (DUF202 family)
MPMRNDLYPAHFDWLCGKMTYTDFMQKTEHRDMIFDEVNLLLSEKRTALSLLRTGIAIFSIPLSIGSVLIATSQLYQPQNILFLLVPVLGGCTLLVLIALWLIINSLIKLRHADKAIEGITSKNPFLRKLVDS